MAPSPRPACALAAQVSCFLKRISASGAAAISRSLKPHPEFTSENACSLKNQGAPRPTVAVHRPTPRIDQQGSQSIGATNGTAADPGVRRQILVGATLRRYLRSASATEPNSSTSPSGVISSQFGGSSAASPKTVCVTSARREPQRKRPSRHGNPASSMDLPSSAPRSLASSRPGWQAARSLRSSHDLDVQHVRKPQEARRSPRAP